LAVVAAVALDALVVALAALAVAEVALAVALASAAITEAEMPDALVAACVADSLALTALAADSLALVVAIAACSVTARIVASVLESPEPPSPLNIAINNSYENKQKGKRGKGTPKNPLKCISLLNS
jgi:hypothetical protein